MLDLDRLRRMRLSRVPPAQILMGELFFRPTFRFPRRTEVVLEGLEHLPRDRPVFIAMNHTDRFNCWPLQFELYRRGGRRYTATWVKGKYYENELLGRALDAANNIPMPSRGYVISTEFRRYVGRAPNEAEYRALRAIVDAPDPEAIGAADLAAAASPDAARYVRAAGDRGFVRAFDSRFDAMIDEVVRLHREAMGEVDLDVIVFPQGTRSKRLSRGHTGLAQMTQALGAPIVPVGCSGSDRLFPGSSPVSKGGRVVYRFGQPLEVDGPELRPHRVGVPFRPLSRSAAAHDASFRAITDAVMSHIDGLVDEPYRFDPKGESDGVAGVKRFL